MSATPWKNTKLYRTVPYVVNRCEIEKLELIVFNVQLYYSPAHE